MGQDKNLLSEFEELVLIAVQMLGSHAYGVPIRKRVSDARGEDVSVGALYTTLDRLEKKGFLSARMGETTAERGGRAKRYYKIEGAGQLALDRAEMMRTRVRTSQIGLIPRMA